MTGHDAPALQRSCGEPVPRAVARFAAFASLMVMATGVPPLAATARAPLWTRLEVVENTAEGTAIERCQVEGTLGHGSATRWRVFYGEARAADPGTGWSAIRTRSGCAQVASDGAPSPWTFRGSPYLVADLSLGSAEISDRELRVEVALKVRRLSGFAENRAPTYETTTEKRVLHLPKGGSAVIPVLVANQKETEEFRVREIVFRFRAAVPGSGPPIEYGEIAISADVPRAEILLDGGFVGRVPYEGPLSLGAVRVGDREIVVRDASLRTKRTVARVEKGRRTAASLELLPESAATPPGEMRSLGPNPHGGQELWRDKDRAIVVRIPGGEFRMGSPEGEGEPSEHPQHLVRIGDFLLDKTEVTWGQYRRFATETGHPLPKSPPVWGFLEDLPVSDVTWDDARAYCTWAGGRLPTEAEWERAARGEDSRRYPWGNDWTPWRCNTRDGGRHAPAAAGAYVDCVSPYGALDLAGSVWEWCVDVYDEVYYAKSPAENPQGPEKGMLRASRGGAWMSPSAWVTGAHRQGTDPGWPDSMRGFRCAQDDRGGTAR